MKVSVIYVYYNTPLELVQSVDSVLDNSKKIQLEIILVDNDSPKRIPKVLEKRKGIKIIRNKQNLGFGRGCNVGAKAATGEYLMFLNPDTLVHDNAIYEMLKTLNEQRVGIVGPKMIDIDGNTLPTINSFLTFPALLVVYSFLDIIFKNNPISNHFWLYDVNRDKEQKVDVLSGACLMIKKTIFEKVGGFDERFFMYFEEQDICLNLRKKGFKAIFNPRAKITHFIGRSLNDKSEIKKYFQESRFLYTKKNLGPGKAIMSELFLRYLTFSNLIAVLTFTSSLFLNIYKQDRLMLFIGDAARDFLAARDMILTHTLPLVGIPSSVPWLHQGPLSIYGIGLAFLLAHFNPIAPGILFGFIGALTTLLLYFFAKKYFGINTAVIASLLYATSPMVVVNARMPYHTSLIPFFTLIFFLTLYKALRTSRYTPLIFFTFGLLLQVELSNIVVGAIILILLYQHKVKVKKNIIYYSVAAFLLGVLPFIIYEFVNGPAYIKFPLWIANRIRLFFGLTLHHNSTTSSLPGALLTTYQQISGTILPHIHVVGLFIYLVAFFYLILGNGNIIKNRYQGGLMLWIIIPLLAFSLHASPGTAYFGLLYPAIILLVAIFFDALVRVNRIFFLLVIFIAFLNANLLVKNDFFASSESGAHPMPPTFYNFGTSWKLSDEVSRAIVDDAKGRSLQVIAKGGLTLYKTSIDPYIYLIWYHGGQISQSSSLKYEIYQPQATPLVRKGIIYNDKGGVVIKSE